MKKNILVLIFASALYLPILANHEEDLIEIKDNPWEFVEYNLFTKPSQNAIKYRWLKKIGGGLLAGGLVSVLVNKILTSNNVEQFLGEEDLSTNQRYALAGGCVTLPLISALATGYLINRKAPKYTEYDYVLAFIKDWPKNKKYTPISLHEVFDKTYNAFLSNLKIGGKEFLTPEEYKPVLSFVKERKECNHNGYIKNMNLAPWEFINEEIVNNAERKLNCGLSKLGKYFSIITGAYAGAYFGANIIKGAYPAAAGAILGGYASSSLFNKFGKNCVEYNALRNFIIAWPENKKYTPEELHKSFDELYELYKESFNGSNNFNKFLKNDVIQFLAIIKTKIEKNLHKSADEFLQTILPPLKLPVLDQIKLVS